MEAHMTSLIRKEPRSLDRKRQRESRTVNNVSSTHAPKDLASLVRGLYGRVACQLDVDPSYVSRVARRERRSEIVEDALRRELKKIVDNINKRRGGVAKKVARKKRAMRTKRTRRRR
jgi:hypothetical protein